MGIKKVVDAEQLDAAMTATASAIREKTGDTTTIPWDTDTGFAVPISEITGGDSELLQKLLTREGEITLDVETLPEFFFNNSHFTTINLPNLKSAGAHAFDRTMAQYIRAPQYAPPEGTDATQLLRDNFKLFLVDLLQYSKPFSDTWSNCNVLNAMIFRTVPSVIAFSTNMPALMKADSDTYGKQGYYYVPAAYVEGLQTANPSLKFRAIEDYPTIYIYRWSVYEPAKSYAFQEWGTTQSSKNVGTSSYYSISVCTADQITYNSLTGKFVLKSGETAVNISSTTLASRFSAGEELYYSASSGAYKIVDVVTYTGTTTYYKKTAKYVSPVNTTIPDWTDLTQTSKVLIAGDADAYPDGGHDGTYWYESLEPFVYTVD